MATVMQFVFLLSMLVLIGVCDPVYKLVNSSVQLDVPKRIVDDDLTWIFNQSENIVKYTGKLRVLGRFEGRVKFDEETHSLTLYNLQKNDSGLYQAEYFGVKKEIVATHQIHVLDPVSKPVFNVSCLRSKNTSNVTFTCEAQELKLTSDCYNDDCDIKNETITGDPFISLSLYISNNLICNHSNPVSWENTAVERKTKEQHCSSAGVTNRSHTMYLSYRMLFLLGVMQYFVNSKALYLP